MLTALLKLRAQLEGSLGRTPTLAELATEAELPLDKVVEVLRYAVDTVSLDEPVRDDGDAELGDFVEDRNAVAPFDARGHVAAAGRGRQGAGGARRARAHDPARCASVSTVAASARSRKWPSTSVSPGSASARSRPGRCRSCGTRPPTSAPASCSKPSRPNAATPNGRTAALRGGRFGVRLLVAGGSKSFGERGVGAGLGEGDAAVDHERLAGDVARPRRTRGTGSPRRSRRLRRCAAAGCRRRSAANASGSAPTSRSSGVRTWPGATQFTRTVGPYSRAPLLVSAITPALAAEYAASLRVGVMPETDAMLTIAPPPAASMQRHGCAHQR